MNKTRASTLDVVESLHGRGCGKFVGYSENLVCRCGQPGVPLCRSCRSRERPVSVTDLTTTCEQCGQPMLFFPELTRTPCDECSKKTQAPSPENVDLAIEVGLAAAPWHASPADAIRSAFAQRGWSIVSSS